MVAPPEGGVTTNDDPLPLRALRDMLDDDADAIGEVLTHFLESLGEAREGLRAALTARDLRGLAAHAHRFKSAAGQMEAMACYQLCMRIDELGRRAEPSALEEATPLVGELLPALDQLERDIVQARASLD